MRAVVIGGTSGLGLEIAKILKSSYEVVITGRKNPDEKELIFYPFDLDAPLEKLVDRSRAVALKALNEIDLLVYAAGFFQEGRIHELSAEDIQRTNNVGLLAPAVLSSQIINIQGSLPGLIAITSTSEWTPRLTEPVYTAVKAGLAMLARSLSLDPRFEKVLVAAPSGMRTKFWVGTDRDTSEMLEPHWVAEQIVEEFEKPGYKFKHMKILRGPARVEISEQRST